MPQSIITNTVVATLGRVVNGALGLVILSALTRYLGPAEYGGYVLILSLGVLVQLGADFGLYLTLAKEIAANPRIFSYIISLRLTLLVVMFGSTTLLLGMIPSYQRLVWGFAIAALGLIFQSISQLTMAVYQHRQAVWRASLGDVLGRLAQLAGLLWVGSQFVSVNLFLAIFSLGAAVAWFFHILWIPRLPRWPRSSKKEWLRLITISWPLGAMLLLNAVYFRIDTLILSLFRPAIDLGMYGAAYRIIESLLFFPAMFGGLLLPKISPLFTTHQTSLLSRYLHEALRLTAFFSGLVLIACLFFARPIITIIAGPSFIDAAPLLAILGIALSAMFFGNIFGFSLVAFNKQRQLLLLYFALAILNIVTNFIWVPRYGAVAAAWTTVLTEVVATLLAGWYVTRIVNLKLPLELILKILVILLSAAAVAFLLSPATPVWLSAAMVILVYGLLGYSLGVISSRHLPLLTS